MNKFENLQDTAGGEGASPVCQEEARHAREGTVESDQAATWASLSLVDTEAAVLTDTEGQMGAAYVAMCARDFVKTEIVAGGVKNEDLKRHMGCIAAMGDSLVAHCGDGRRAMLVTKHLWMKAAGGPKIDPEKLDELRDGVD